MLASLLSPHRRDRLRYLQQRLLSAYRRGRWLLDNLFDARTAHHLRAIFRFSKVELNRLDGWLPFIPVRVPGCEKVLSTIAPNKNAPLIFGRPTLWPARSRFLPERNIRLCLLDNVLVTEEGRVFDVYGRTAKDLWHSPPVFFHKHMQRALHGIELTRREASAVIHRMDEIVVIQQQTNRTYGHFLVEILPRLLIAREHLPQSLPVYFALDHAVYASALHMLGIDTERLIDARQYPVVLAGTAHIPKFTRRRGWIGGVQLLQQAAKEICERVSAMELPETPRRVFVSRRTEGDDSFRASSLANYPAVVERARSRGFEVVYPETLSFAEQVNLFRRAEAVAGEHGSGLFNAIFCKPGTPVFDLQAAHPMPMLFDVLQPMGIAYVAVLTPEGSMVRWQKRKFSCDLDALTRAFDHHRICG